MQASGCAQHIKTVLHIDVPGPGADQDAMLNAPLAGESDVDENGILDSYVLADVGVTHNDVAVFIPLVGDVG